MHYLILTLFVVLLSSCVGRGAQFSGPKDLEVRFNATEASAELSWQRVYKGDFSHYEVQRFTAGEFAPIATLSTNTDTVFVDRGLYGKQLMYEQSARVPLVVRWPRGFDAADRSQALASTLDLMATFLDVGGASLPVDHGRSLLPVLRGDTAAHRDEVFCELDAEKMVRQGPWKYVYHPEREVQQLFHLDDDPHELRNLAATGDHTGKEQALRDRILAWMIDTEPRPHGVRQPAR